MRRSSSRRLVSYDIWDTVLRRRCHPDAVKLHIARCLIHRLGGAIKPHLCDPWLLFYLRQSVERDIGREHERLGFDNEYRLRDVYRLWIKRAAVVDDQQTDDLLNELVDLEMAQERRVVYLDPTIKNRINHDGAERRVFISDFYMGKDAIWSLLQHVGISNLFDDGYVSCDYLLNKRSGRLFQVVLDAEAINCSSLVHYGDNPHSDVEMPRRLGINANLYAPENEDRIKSHNNQRFINRGEAISRLFHEAVASDPSVPNEVSSFACKASILFIGFVLFVQEQIVAHELGSVFFFSREGEFFHQIYQQLRSASPNYDLLPEGQVLEVSRLATFGPSLRSVDEAELMRLWNLYSVQTPAAFLKSLDLLVDDYEPLIREHGIDPHEEIRYPWQDVRMQKLLHHPVFIERLNRELGARRERLLKYCAERGLTASTSRCAIIDIGWRGTIQDNLAWMMPDIEFLGLYLGLDRFLNNQPPNVRKLAFGPNMNIDDSEAMQHLLRYVAPIEMLANSPYGSVVGYEERAGRVEAVRIVDKDENAIYDEFTSLIQQCILNVCRQIAECIAHDSIGAEEIHLLALNAWRDMIENPDTRFAQAYFRLVHNETFGLGRFVSKKKRLRPFWPIWLMLSRNYRVTFRKELSDLGWPEGYAKATRDWLLLPVLRTFYS